VGFQLTSLPESGSGQEVSETPYEIGLGLGAC